MQGSQIMYSMSTKMLLPLLSATAAGTASLLAFVSIQERSRQTTGATILATSGGEPA
jgi:hypothetical protein